MRIALTCSLPLLVLVTPTAAQTQLSPAVSFSVHDEPRDGLGDLFNAPPFEGLLREQSSREDRAMQEFDVSAFAGATVGSATLSGSVHVNNAFDNGPRLFDFLLYTGNGTAELADFQIAGTFVGSGMYHPPMDTSFTYSFDVTAVLQTLLDGGASFVGLKVDPTSDPNFPSILSDTTSILEITTAGGIGSSYCGPAIPNSTTFPGEITASGSTAVADDNVNLTASGLPPGQFGYFLAGRTQGFFNPPGSQGFICLSGTIGRYNQPQNIIQGPNGTISIDLSAIPVSPPQPVLPGETWNFQAWYRDVNPGATSNFTDGVSITFL